MPYDTTLDIIFGVANYPVKLYQESCHREVFDFLARLTVQSSNHHAFAKSDSSPLTTAV